MTLRRFSAALVAVALLACAGPAAAKPPVWIVRDKDSELVLFGSIHVLQADLDWRPARLDQALKTADDLWFELPIDADSQAETARLAVAHGYLPQDQSLTAMLSPKGRTRLAKALSAARTCSSSGRRSWSTPSCASSPGAATSPPSASTRRPCGSAA
ncbi:MAG TPA: TraB/GumN family protein, partial [Phenylobacterium sp.]|nr:TraB/GumN family protein [Phenylobacterium sp.]